MKYADTTYVYEYRRRRKRDERRRERQCTIALKAARVLAATEPEPAEILPHYVTNAFIRRNRPIAHISLTGRLVRETTVYYMPAPSGEWRRYERTA